MAWTVVYDFARDWFDLTDWIFPASGLPFVLAGFFMVRYGYWIRGSIFLAFSIAWTVGHTIRTIELYQALSRAYHGRTYQVAEGTVENFQMPRCGDRGAETFRVNGVGFHYADARIQMGFRQTRCSGGPMRGGLYVRIWSVELPSRTRHIIRLEIRR